MVSKDSTSSEEGRQASTRRPRAGLMRQRFIDVAAKLLREHGVAGVSTRLICETVGVKAPTLYHHFGDYSGLQAAVVAHAFEQYYRYWKDRSVIDDPFQRVRDGWDSYIAFSRDEPELFVLVAQQNFTGVLPQQIVDAHRGLIDDLRLISQMRPLRYSPELGAQIFTAACMGVASMLAAQQRGVPLAPDLSAVTREAVLDSLLL